ncbi:MAG: YbhB/YbcL family Raf kinase inhibitor-like protein [Actinomycetota bacterium]
MTHDTATSRRGQVTLIGLVGLLLTACSTDGREMRPPRPDQSQTIIESTLAPVAELSGFDASIAPAPTFALTLPWSKGGPIPADYTCGGSDVSPPLVWSGVPVDTASLAIVVTDLDATTADGQPFVHWIVANIPPSITAVPTGGTIAGSIEALNDFTTAEAPRSGWSGPCPPLGATHTYSFEVRALDQFIELSNDSPAADLLAAIDAATVATASGTGTVVG